MPSGTKITAMAPGGSAAISTLPRPSASWARTSRCRRQTGGISAAVISQADHVTAAVEPGAEECHAADQQCHAGMAAGASAPRSSEREDEIILHLQPDRPVGQGGLEVMRPGRAEDEGDMQQDIGQRLVEIAAGIARLFLHPAAA